MRDAFAVLFFVSVGMLFNPAFLLGTPGLLAATLAIVLVGKPVAALAIVFGALALKNGAGRVPIRRGFARFGIGLGVLQIVLVITALVLFWDDVMRFFEFVERFQTQPE